MSSKRCPQHKQRPSAANIFPSLGLAPVALAIAMGHITTAHANPVLIDFGNNSSFRGASQTGADSNGLYWTSIHSGAYFSNLINGSNTATNLGFGFAAGNVGLGTDSYNGPSGATANPVTQAHIDAANINAGSLGILGGSKAAAFDFYVATDGRFVIQGLNANETYNLTFFGSAKYRSATTTDYAVYSDNTYSTAVGSTSLFIGSGANNNTSNTATIAGLAPQSGNGLHVRFGANSYAANGIINAMSVVGYVPYLSGSTTNINAAKTYTGNTILGNSTTANANVAGALGGGSSALQMDGQGSLSLGANQTVTSLIGSGNLALTTGTNTLTLNTSGSSTFSVLTSSNGSFANNDYSGVLSGNGTINKTGSGNQILSGANTFSGTISANAGTLTLNHVDALQNAKLDTTYVGNGVVSFGVAGNNTYKLGGLLGNRGISMGANSLDISTANGSSFYDGVLSGVGSLTKSGAGTFTMRGNNSFTGSVTISAGTLQISDDGPASGGSIASSSGITNDALLVYNLSANDRTYAKVIGGSGSLTKVGARTLTLSGTNTYTGATSVNGGKLVVNGNISTSSLTSVSSGATLGGSGTVGAVTVANGATLAPGNSPGTLNTGSLILNDASDLSFELNPTNTTVGSDINDLVNVTGNLTLDGILNVVATSGDFLATTIGTTWRLFNYTGTLTNNSVSLGSMPSLGDVSYTWQIDTATAGQVNLVVIPEPGAALLGGLSVIALFRRRRD